MAATMGFAELSTALMASCRPGDSGGLPNSVMSAPAMKVRPSQASTPTLISGSCASFATPSMRAARTPTLMALTGGLLIQMIPTLPRFSNLPCMVYSNRKRKLSKPPLCVTNRRCLASDPPAAIDQVNLAGGLRCHSSQIVDGFGHLFGEHQAAERGCRSVIVQHRLKAFRPQAVSEPGRINHSGSNYIHPDLRTQHPRQRQAQRIQRALRRNVGKARAAADQRGNGGYIDDGPVRAISKQRREFADHLIGSDHVDRVNILKISRAEAVEILQVDEFRCPCIVHQRVAAPEMRFDAPRQLSALPIMGNIS